MLKKMSREEIRNKIDKIDLKYKDILEYLPDFDDRKDPHSDFLDMAMNIRRDKRNGNAIATLSRIGNYCDESVRFMIIDENGVNRERRWRIDLKGKDKRLKEEGEKNKLREYESPKDEIIPKVKTEEEMVKDVRDSSVYYEGREIWTACMTYSITDKSKKDAFLKKILTEKNAKDPDFMGSFKRGPHPVNNTKIDILLMGEDYGKAMAPKMADTLDKMRKSSGKFFTCDIEDVVRDIMRLKYIGGIDHYRGYMNNLKKNEKSLYSEVYIENPKELMICSGNVHKGTTFKEQIEYTKTEGMRIMGLNGNGKH